jgi:hypothetical protein
MSEVGNLDSEKLFAETQDFLKDQKELLNTLAKNTLDFIQFFFEQSDEIDIWEEWEDSNMESGKVLSDEFLIVKEYLQGRIRGEFQHKIVFGSLNTNFGIKEK